MTRRFILAVQQSLSRDVTSREILAGRSFVSRYYARDAWR
jgi:hypothetical protein